jgi:hypothetical protein
MLAYPYAAPGAARVGSQAKPRQTCFTVLAEPAADVERQANHVARLHAVHADADLDDLAHVLVTEDLALFHVSAALVHVQIATANIGRGDLDQGICRSFDLRVRNLIN